MEAGQRVCVYYCSTYYKAVREGGGGGDSRGNALAATSAACTPLRDLLFLMSFDPCFPLPNAAAPLFPSIASGAHADAKVCRFRYASPVPLPSPSPAPRSFCSCIVTCRSALSLAVPVLPAFAQLAHCVFDGLVDVVCVGLERVVGSQHWCVPD